MDIVCRRTGKMLDDTQVSWKYLMPRHPDCSVDITVFGTGSKGYFLIVLYCTEELQ